MRVYKRWLWNQEHKAGQHCNTKTDASSFGHGHYWRSPGPQVAKPHRAAPQQREPDIADLAFIAKLGKDSHQLSMGIVLLVDGQLGARLQLLLWMNDANIIDDGNFLLGVPQNEGPDPVQAMA